MQLRLQNLVPGGEVVAATLTLANSHIYLYKGRAQSIKWWFTESEWLVCVERLWHFSLHTSHWLFAWLGAERTHFFRLSTCLSITARSRPKSPFVAVGRSSLARERAILVPWHLSSEKTMCVFTLCLRTKAGVKNAATRHTPVLNFGVARQGTQFRRNLRPAACKFQCVIC